MFLARTPRLADRHSGRATLPGESSVVAAVLTAFATARLVAALALGPAPSPVADPSAAAIQPALAMRAEARPSFFGEPAPAPRDDGLLPPCLGDVCQPRVSVPGYEPRYGRSRRTELVVLALDRARLEPFATIGWALLTTGIRLDYTPASFDSANPAARGWGAVFLRFRLRMDAYNTLVFPSRTR